MKYKIIKHLKLTPFDTATESGRTQERYRLSAWGTIANITSSSLSLLVLFITVPLTISYLGEERFGVWMTIASLAGMLTFLDMGVGNGFVSHIANINVLNDFERFKCTVTRGLLLLTIIGITVGVFLSVFNVLVPLDTVVSVETTEARDDVRISAWVFILLFSLSIPLNGIYRIYQGMQKSWVVHIIKVFGSVITILSVLVLSEIEAGPSSLLLATYGVQTLMPMILFVYIIKKHWLTLSPHQNWEESKLEYKHLLSIGGLFFVLQVGTMIGWGADTLIISSLAGAAAVTQFAIAQRLYQFVILPMSIINAPLWGAYADAKAHKDKNFIAITLKRSLIGTFGLSVFLSVTLFFLSGVLLKLWLGGSVQVSESLLVGFAIWTVMQATGSSFAMFLNGMHIVKPQVISVIFFVILALPLKIFFVPIYGADAVVWSTVLAYSISVVLYYVFIFKRVIMKEYRQE